MAFINVKKCLSDPKQLIKLVVLIVCLCVTCYQLSECVRKLINPPVSTHYRFQLNESLKHPAITICRRPAYKKHLFPKFGLRVPDSGSTLFPENFFDNFRFDKFTIKEFLEETTYSFAEIFIICSFNGNHYTGEDKGVVNIRSAYHFNRGKCYTMIPKQPSSDITINGGHYFFLKHDGADEEDMDYEGLSGAGFDIYFHNDEEALTDVDGQADSFTENVFLPSHEMDFVALNFADFLQISTKQKPCISDPKYSKPKCQEQCAHREIARNNSCTTPWLKHLEEDYPLCNSSAQLNSLMEKIVNYMNNGWKDKCNCVESCEVNLYSAIVDRREKSNTTTDIKIYASSNVVTVAQEIITYDLNVFISDIGGSMGFLLGLSVIGIMTTIEEFVRILLKRKNAGNIRRHSKNEDNEHKEFVEEIKDENRLNIIRTYLVDCDVYKNNSNPVNESTSKNKY